MNRNSTLLLLIKDVKLLTFDEARALEDPRALNLWMLARLHLRVNPDRGEPHKVWIDSTQDYARTTLIKFFKEYYPEVKLFGNLQGTPEEAEVDLIITTYAEVRIHWRNWIYRIIIGTPGESHIFTDLHVPLDTEHLLVAMSRIFLEEPRRSKKHAKK